jgi:hypothetical protein
MLRVRMTRFIPIRAIISDTGRGYVTNDLLRALRPRDNVAEPLALNPAHGPRVHFSVALARCFPLESFATQEI